MVDPVRIVYFGTPVFAAEVLRYLISRGVTISAVISKPDKAHGRSRAPQPVPVKGVAESFHIPIYQPEKVSSPDFQPILQSFHADLFVVVAYGEILKQSVLDMPSKGCINLHASVLPAYRGAAPIQRAIINGDAESGVTVMHMARKMDAGDIIAIRKTPIASNMTYGELEESLCAIGKELLFETIQKFAAGAPDRTPQDEANATMAPKLELEDCGIDWSRNAAEIHNLVRGVNPEPGAWCKVQFPDAVKRLKIFRTLMDSSDATHLKAGECLFTSGKKLLAGCGKGTLELVEVQLEGKKRMSASDFFRGLPAGFKLNLS